ncbi:OBAP family protein [Microbacterium sp. p3-SID336]|uniref:OBAP family protein n=1 Tax=Microbacterium sp. p3-SID336 TaxID=2916212 RepID=UPI0021A95A7A|nr:OBAP family protein [Microbacterium sp. p3-SID336]MCT1478959.1 OBAP family protein [Microbacterium sp. p3-SID336]
MPGQNRPSPLSPEGDRKGLWLSALEHGAAVLQSAAPLKKFDVYVSGFHPAKDDPSMQMEAHHYCQVVNDDFIQAVLFDGNTAEANLIGVEYIISEALFATLPDDEKAYWHPHNYEVLSGSLVAPGLPAAAEKALMKRLLNSYGKTWHAWHTGRHDIGGGHTLPLGEPLLMWSFNRDGECDPSLEGDREEAMGLDTAATREQRADLAELAHPQAGVDLLKDQLGGTPLPGVVDVNDAHR